MKINLKSCCQYSILLLFVFSFSSGSIISTKFLFRTKDSIQVLSIVSEKVNKNDKSITLLVDSEYHLFTKKTGILNVGYLTNNGAYRMVSSVSKIVQNGKGNYTFRVNIPYHQLCEKIKILVNLSEYPHPKKWNPIADNRSVFQLAICNDNSTDL